MPRELVRRQRDTAEWSVRDEKNACPPSQPRHPTRDDWFHLGFQGACLTDGCLAVDRCGGSTETRHDRDTGDRLHFPERSRKNPSEDRVAFHDPTGTVFAFRNFVQRHVFTAVRRGATEDEWSSKLSNAPRPGAPLHGPAPRPFRHAAVPPLLPEVSSAASPLMCCKKATKRQASKVHADS